MCFNPVTFHYKRTVKKIGQDIWYNIGIILYQVGFSQPFRPNQFVKVP